MQYFALFHYKSPNDVSYNGFNKFKKNIQIAFGLYVNLCIQNKSYNT